LLISPSTLPLLKEIINLSQAERELRIKELHHVAVEGKIPVEGTSAEHPTTEDLGAMDPVSKGDPGRSKANFRSLEVRENTEGPSQKGMKNFKRKKKEITHLGSVQTAILWNRSQLNVLQGEKKKVLLIADFGSGKTLMLKTKALVLAHKLREQKKKEQVFYVSFVADWKETVSF
jgi:hypothetical protein